MTLPPHFTSVTSPTPSSWNLFILIFRRQHELRSDQSRRIDANYDPTNSAQRSASVQPPIHREPRIMIVQKSLYPFMSASSISRVIRGFSNSPQ